MLAKSEKDLNREMNAKKSQIIEYILYLVDPSLDTELKLLRPSRTRYLDLLKDSFKSEKEDTVFPMKPKEIDRSLNTL